MNLKERRRDAVHRHEGLQGYDDAIRVSTLLSVSPAALFHDWDHGDKAVHADMLHFNQANVSMFFHPWLFTHWRDSIHCVTPSSSQILNVVRLLYLT